VEFEFDPQKSAINKAKHGIDFVEAQALWKSKQVRLGAKDALEKRYMIIGKIEHEHWSAIITYRGATDSDYQCKKIDAIRDLHV
jgi:uncharacterized DUF497 family protein